MKSFVLRSLFAVTVLTCAASASAQPTLAPRAPLAQPAVQLAPGSVQITRDQVRAFGVKLDGFRNGLPAQERRVFDGIMTRSGSRPAEDVTKPIPRTSAFDRSDTDLPSTIHGALGLRTPVRPGPGGNAALGPKQDDPGPPPPPDSIKALGPKQDDPGPPPPPDSMTAFAGKLSGFVNALAPQDKAILGVIFLRASQAGASNASGPGGCFPPLGSVGAPRGDIISGALRLGGAPNSSFVVSPLGAAPAPAAPRPNTAPGGIPRAR